MKLKKPDGHSIVPVDQDPLGSNPDDWACDPCARKKRNPKPQEPALFIVREFMGNGGLDYGVCLKCAHKWVKGCKVCTKVVMENEGSKDSH